MSPFVFDTLSASKQLREAGMAEGVAEAVVSVFQHAATMPDISHLATKVDVADMTTKGDLALMATKADIADMATKADMADMATKADFADMATKSGVKAELDLLRHEMRTGFAEVRAELSEKLRQQALVLTGGITALVTLVNVTLKVFG